MNFLSKILGKPSKHSIETFVYYSPSTLHQDLQQLSPITHKNKDRVIESIRAITEEIIWSEQNSGDFFKYSLFRYVIECNLFRLFWNFLMEVKIKEVHVQLIQTATMLIHNLNSNNCKSKEKIEYLLNTIFYREIVGFNFDFSDEEVVEIYMSMLKAFAINLKPEVFAEFVTCNNFNVMNGAIMFMNYHESMIKIASRTVILNVLSGKSKSVKGYVVKSGLFSVFVSGLSEKLSLCDRLILSNNVSKLESTLSEISEDLYYINDVLELQIKEFNESLCNILIKTLIYPIAISSLGSINHSAHHLSIPLSGTILYHILKIVKNPDLNNALTMGILSKLIPEPLASLLQEAPSPNIRQSDKYLEASLHFLDKLEGFPSSEALVPNQVPDIIFSFLTSKDNNLIGTTLILLHTIINSVSVSNNLLLAAGLISYEKLKIKNLLNNILDTRDYSATYCNQAVEALIGLLEYEHPLRLFLFKLACKVLISLTFRKEQSICLGPNHQSILNRALLRSIQNLQEFLTDDSEYDEFFEVFKSEWKTLSVPEPKLSNLVHLLLPYNEELEGVPLEYRNPLNDSEALRCEISRFFAIWSVKLALCKDNSIFPLSVYPLYHLSNAVIWEKGKSYNLKNKNLVKCVVKLKKNEENFFYASDADFFLLAIPDPKYEDFYLIKFVESLINVETMQDRADPRRLVLMINSNSEPFNIIFNDPQQCLWTLREISGSKQSCRERYITLVSTLFDQLTSKISEL